MAKTLLDGWWYDGETSPGALWEEIESIDRVINLRIKHATEARTRGIIVSALDAGKLVDDLLWRRQCVLDLIMALRWEDTFDSSDRVTFRTLTTKIARNRCDRFVG